MTTETCSDLPPWRVQNLVEHIQRTPGTSRDCLLEMREMNESRLSKLEGMLGDLMLSLHDGTIDIPYSLRDVEQRIGSERLQTPLHQL